MTLVHTDVDRADRLAYLADTVELLWPGQTSGAREMAVVPSPRTPRLLVPVRPRRAAAAAVRRYTAQQGARERVAGLALAAGLVAGWRPSTQSVGGVGAGGTIADHLSDVLGTPVVTALALTHDRPNRKPVLQVFDERGHTLAFGKIGVSPLAAQLVDSEAAALNTLSRLSLPHVQLPEVLHHGRWHGLPVLVTAPLPMRRAPRPYDPVLLEAMRELSGAGNGELGSYLGALRGRAAALGDAATAWRATFEELVAGRDVHDVRMGSWHGDFTEWNCARAGDRLMVWDVERFAHPAPLGFDRLHYLLNREVRRSRDRFRPVAESLVAAAPRLLTPWRLEPETARTVALMYLLDIALRYLADDLRASDPGGDIDTWALPVVRAGLRGRPGADDAPAPSA